MTDKTKPYNRPLTFDTIRKAAIRALETMNLPQVYFDRLSFECEEILKQGSERYWVDIFEQGIKFDKNPNGLVLPWVLLRLVGDADVDPIANRKDPLVTSTNYKTINGLMSELGRLPFDIYQDADKPDIDIDCLPAARDELREFSSKRYGQNNVASVGTWQTYLFKQAVNDVYYALGLDVDEQDEWHAALAKFGTPGNQQASLVERLTVTLPEDVNFIKSGGVGACKGKSSTGEECGFMHSALKCPKCNHDETETPTLAQTIAENEQIRIFLSFREEHTHVLETAVRLIGCISHTGKHAGAIIIADRDLFGNVPMEYKDGQYVSLWSEGSNTQLSKFGYTKWDILGLKNLWYISECCKMIEQNHGVSFGDRLTGLQDVNPVEERAGSYWIDGEKYSINLHDEAALGLANRRKTDAVFQFDTDLAKRTLSNGVSSFWDLLVFNAMGHPGPMAMIPEYVARRDDPNQGWRKTENELSLRVLEKTNGIIVYQEQLTDLWQLIAGFTGPESQDARKAVAKKWKDKLKPVRQKWIDGASKYFGVQEATRWWDDIMAPFGRYAFNKSHAVSYCLVAYTCLWLKAYYPEEWWASVMGLCHQDKLNRYMSAAREDKVQFGTIDINHMTVRPVALSGKRSTAEGNKVAIGLINLKKIGETTALNFADGLADTADYKNIDEFVAAKGKNKTLLERLVKLGAFTKLHPNIKATWMWCLHSYCTGEVDVDGVSMKVTDLRKKHCGMLLERDGWTQEKIAIERERQVAEYKKTYPKRSKIPKKVTDFEPDPNDTMERVMSLYEDDEDYDIVSILQFEKEFLGYYWHSPVEMYKTSGTRTIEDAKDRNELEGVITDKYLTSTRTGNPMLKLTITDGPSSCLVIVWDSELKLQDESIIQIDAGVKLVVNYDEDRDSFTLARSSKIKLLQSKREWNRLAALVS